MRIGGHRIQAKAFIGPRRVQGEAGISGFEHSDPDDRDWANFRAEGLPLKESLGSAFSYARKYWEKKWTASVETSDYFHTQSDWFKYFQDLDTDENKPTARAAVVGDIMWIRDGWKSFLQPDVQTVMMESDIVMGNLETPISPNFAVPSLLPDAVTFNSEPELITQFQRSNSENLFTALSFANNHSLDKGVEGALDTRTFLEAQGIATSGVHQPGQQLFSTFERQGIKFGFYAATWGLNDPEKENPEGLRINLIKGLTPVRIGDKPADEVDLTEIQEVLNQMEKQGVEQKVIALHWGHEFEMYPTSAQMNLARRIVQAGADIILGSHSHVVQPSEILFVNGYEGQLNGKLPEIPPEMLVTDAQGEPRKALVVYSPGNFTTNMFTTQCQLGALQTVEYHRDENGKLDWDDPETRFVFNDRGGFLSSRQLVMAENAEFSAGELAEYNRLKKHVPGVPGD